MEFSVSSLKSRFRAWVASWTHNRDHLLALLVLIGGLGLFPMRLVIGHIYAKVVPPTLIIAALAYLGATRWLPRFTSVVSSSSSSATSDPPIPTLPGWASRVLPIGVCWVLVATLALTLYSATTPTSTLTTATSIETLVGLDIGRGLGIYVFTSIAGSLVLAQIAFVRDRDFAPRFLLAQLLAVCVVLRGSAFILTPSYIGIDVFTHAAQYATVLVDTGSLQTALGGSKYISAPFYYLLVAATALTSGLGIQWAVYLSVSLGMLLTPVLVYCGARRLPGVGSRWALFGAALFGLMDYITYWTLHAIPSSLALVFALGILVLLVHVLTSSGTSHRGVTLSIALLCLGVVATDQVTAFILVILFGTAVGIQLLFYAGRRLSPSVSRVRSRSQARSSTGSLILSSASTRRGHDLRLSDMASYAAFAAGLTLFVWAFTPYYGATFTESVLRTLSDAITASTGTGSGGLFATFSSSASAASGSGGPPSLGARIMTYASQLGFVLLLGASVIGTCGILRRRPRSLPDQANATLIGIVTIIGVFAFVPALVGIGTFLSGRWYAILYAGMGLLVASGFAQVWGQRDKSGSGSGPGSKSDSRSVSYRPLVACLLVIICLHPIAGAVSVDATFDAPVRDDATPRYAFTGPEGDAAETLMTITNSSEDQPVYTDRLFGMRLTRPDPGSNNYFTAVVNDSGVPADHDRMIYRDYQATGGPSFTNPETGETRVQQLASNVSDGRSVCDANQSLAYNNGFVTYCIQSEG